MNLFTPHTRALEHLQPRRLQEVPLLRPVGPGPSHQQSFATMRESSPFLRMRHHAHVVSVRRAQRSDGVLRSVRIERIVLGHFSVVVNIAHGDASAFLGLALDLLVGPVALSLSVSDPYAECGSLHSTKEDGVGLFNAHVDEATLELSSLVLDEAGLFGSVLDGKRHVVDLTHQLAAVADAEREAVLLLDEPLELLADGIVKEDAGGPSSRAIQHVLA